MARMSGTTRPATTSRSSALLKGHQPQAQPAGHGEIARSVKRAVLATFSTPDFDSDKISDAILSLSRLILTLSGWHVRETYVSAQAGPALSPWRSARGVGRPGHASRGTRPWLHVARVCEAGRRLACRTRTSFRDFGRLLAEISARGFERFVASLDKAAEAARNSLAKLKAMGRAYVAFAFANPAVYGLMFRMGVPLRRPISRRRRTRPGSSFAMPLLPSSGLNARTR